MVDSREETLAQIRLIHARFGRCPDCNHGELVAGPWGGASRNIFCPMCMVRWNFHGVSHGIVAVEHGGECDQGDLDHAIERYPGDQPFKPVVTMTIQDCAEFYPLIGGAIDQFLPDNVAVLCIIMDGPGNVVLVGNTNDADRLKMLQQAAEKMLRGEPKKPH